MFSLYNKAAHADTKTALTNAAVFYGNGGAMLLC